MHNSDHAARGTRSATWLHFSYKSFSQPFARIALTPCPRFSRSCVDIASSQFGSGKCQEEEIWGIFVPFFGYFGKDNLKKKEKQFLVNIALNVINFDFSISFWCFLCFLRIFREADGKFKTSELPFSIFVTV